MVSVWWRCRTKVKIHKGQYETAVNRNVCSSLFLYTYTIKPPAMLVVPLTALALDKKTSNDIISVGPKPHYI